MMVQRSRKNEREKVEAFSRFTLILPLDHCAETALEVVEKDAMCDWFTSPMHEGFCSLDFSARPGIVEFIIVEELEGNDAQAAAEVVFTPKDAARFLQRFGRAYRLHLQSGKMLIYLAGFNHEESFLYWQAPAQVSSSQAPAPKRKTPTRARSSHQKALSAQPGGGASLQRKQQKKGKAS